MYYYKRVLIFKQLSNKNSINNNCGGIIKFATVNAKMQCELNLTNIDCGNDLQLVIRNAGVTLCYPLLKIANQKIRNVSLSEGHIDCAILSADKSGLSVLMYAGTRSGLNIDMDIVNQMLDYTRKKSIINKTNDIREIKDINKISQDENDVPEILHSISLDLNKELNKKTSQYEDDISKQLQSLTLSFDEELNNKVSQEEIIDQLQSLKFNIKEPFIQGENDLWSFASQDNEKDTDQIQSLKLNIEEGLLAQGENDLWTFTSQDKEGNIDSQFNQPDETLNNVDQAEKDLDLSTQELFTLIEKDLLNDLSQTKQEINNDSHKLFTELDKELYSNNLSVNESATPQDSKDGDEIKSSQASAFAQENDLNNQLVFSNMQESSELPVADLSEKSLNDTIFNQTTQDNLTEYEKFVSACDNYYLKEMSQQPFDINLFRSNSIGKFKSVEEYSNAFEQYYAGGRNGNYYQSVKEQLQQIFDTFTPYTSLIDSIPCSYWVKVNNNKSSNYFIIGLISKNDTPYAIGYALPSSQYSRVDDKDFIYKKFSGDSSRCYYILFQDCITGSLIKELDLNL